MNSGTFSTSNGYIKYNIELTLLSQDAEANSSQVNVKVRFWRTNTGYATYGTGTVYCTIDGTVRTAAVTPQQRITEDGIVLFDETATVRHNPDGFKNLAVSARINHQQVTSGDGAWTFALPRITLAARAGIEGDADVGSAVELRVLGYLPDYVYTFQYSPDGARFTDIVTIAEDAWRWVLPDALAEAIPNDTEGRATLRLISYLDGAQVGYRDLEFAYRVPEDYAKPDVTLAAAQVNRANIDAYIATESTVTLSARAALNCGAAVRLYTFTVGGAAHIVRDAGAACDYVFLLPDVDGAELAASVTVTDSRGYTSAPQALTLPVLAYAPPEITSIRAVRGRMEPDPETSAEHFVEDVDGDRLCVRASGRIAPLEGRNARAYAADYRIMSAAKFGELFPRTALDAYEFEIERVADAVFSTELAYDLRFSVSDALNSATEVLAIRSQRVLMNFSADGRSICIGGMATYPDTLQSWLNLLPSGGIRATEVPDGQDIDELTVSGWYYGADGEGKFGIYVEQIGENVRCQRLRRYVDGRLETRVRCAVNRAWGDWVKAETEVEEVPIESVTSTAEDYSIPYTSDGRMTLLTPDVYDSRRILVAVKEDSGVVLRWADESDLLALIENSDKAEAKNKLGIYYADVLPDSGDEGDICLVPS